MRFVIPFGPLSGDAHAERYRTLLQLELTAFAAEFRLTEFVLRARFEGEEDRNAVVWIGRGLGGTAVHELPATQIPRPDANQQEPTFRMRYGFLVEPYSEPGDLLLPRGIPSGKIIGPIRWKPRDAVVVRPPHGLRLLAASKQDFRATFSGHLEVEAR